MTTTLTDDLDGIAYKELRGSNTIHYEPTSVSAVRVFRTAWNDRLTFIRRMVGEVILASDGSTVVVSPKQHPEMPGLYAMSADTEPFHTASRNIPKGTLATTDDPIEYDFAKVTIHYGTSTFQAGTGDTETLITEEVNISAQALGLKGSEFYYGDANGVVITPNEPVAEAVGIMVGIVEDSIVFHKSSTNKRAIIKSLVGTINDAALVDSPRGSVLFIGAQSKRTIDINGAELWELKYVLKTRTLPGLSSQTNSWQKVWKQDAGWRTVHRQYDTSKGIYEYGDFAQLFT